MNDEHEIDTNSRRSPLRCGTVIALPDGAYYCGACRRVLPEAELARNEPRRHPLVATVFCADCRASGAAELACIKWERDLYRQEFRAVRAKVRRLQGATVGSAVAA